MIWLPVANPMLVHRAAFTALVHRTLPETWLALFFRECEVTFRSEWYWRLQHGEKWAKYVSENANTGADAHWVNRTLGALQVQSGIRETTFPNCAVCGSIVVAVGGKCVCVRCGNRTKVEA